LSAAATRFERYASDVQVSDFAQLTRFRRRAPTPAIRMPFFDHKGPLDLNLKSVARRSAGRARRTRWTGRGRFGVAYEGSSVHVRRISRRRFDEVLGMAAQSLTAIPGILGR